MFFLEISRGLFSFFKDEILNMKRVKLLEELAAANPDLAEVYRQKIPVTQAQYERASSRETLNDELVKVGTILDQVEQDLKIKNPGCLDLYSL